MHHENPKINKNLKGRFAPTPSGRLHFGSLTCALASYLDVKAKNGSWIIRLDDLDSPRVQRGASENIIRTLEYFNLISDEPIRRQSDNLALYEEIFGDLIRKNLTYRCECSRKRLQSLNNVYDYRCRNKKLSHEKTSVRLKISETNNVQNFIDNIQGNQETAHITSDFIIRRKDKIFAYEYAVVIDDYVQNITSVLRGADLISSTFNQLILHKSLNFNPPLYSHIPVVENKDGKKMSKSKNALMEFSKTKLSILYLALDWLGQNPPAELKNESNQIIIDWAKKNWCPKAIPQLLSKSITEQPQIL